MQKYKIKEIFGPTIQGEGSQAGKPVFFIRFSGCNKWNGREQSKAKSICSYCDTDFVGGDWMTAHDINERVVSIAAGYPIKILVLSGGEPTMQVDSSLIETLKNYGWEIHIETNGTSDMEKYHHLIDHITMSPKQSPQQTKLKSCSDIKFLYPYIGNGITPKNFSVSDISYKNIFIQPIMRDDYHENLKEAIDECLLYNYRLSIQQHKIIGVD